MKPQNEMPKKMYESQKNIEFSNNIQLKFLYYSKINDYEKCLEIIDEKGCPREQCINVKGDNDWTALHYASLHGNIKLTNLLLFHEAIIDAETNAKMTPLMIACQKYIKFFFYFRFSIIKGNDFHNHYKSFKLLINY